MLYCPTSGRKKSFEKKVDLDMHILKDNHQVVEARGAMDSVRSSFISKMKSWSHSHEVNSS